MTSATTELAVATIGLRKTYRTRRGRQVALQGLDLAVPVGGVHGFLGPNGSGKTTTIRMLLGLASADSGTMQIFDHQVPERLPEVVGRVGAIVESPKFFPAFTGRKNLSLLADAIGTSRTRIDEVLEETGLGDRGEDRYKGYSLGMKQRLAIAATLLKSPDLLIFDEPTNGLDPAGIRQIRETMRQLGQQGRTVLVSSHVLAEVEQVADTVSIIGRGRLLAAGTVDDVIGGSIAAAVRVGVSDPDTAMTVLADNGLTVTREAEMLRVDGETDPARITYLLAQHQLYVNELTPVKLDLESVFLELTSADTLGHDNVERPPDGFNVEQPPDASPSNPAADDAESAGVAEERR